MDCAHVCVRVRVMTHELLSMSSGVSVSVSVIMSVSLRTMTFITLILNDN
jgi:hypothetical protein